jgi:alkyl hydroperoxide reductase subunit AhpC
MRGFGTLIFSSILLFASAAQAAAPVETLKVGQNAPVFSMKTLNPKLSKTRVFSLRKVVGPTAKSKQTVVLSFAASYCEPCKKELAELKPLAADFKKAGVILAVVVVDTEPEGIAAMKDLTVTQLELPFPVLSDRFGVLARRYHADQLPKTVVIQPDGTVKWMSTGFKKGALKALKAQVGMGS